MTINYYASIFIPKLEQMDRPSAEHAAGKRRHTVAKRENDLRKYSRSELLEILVEQGRRIETLERELDCACRALGSCSPRPDRALPGAQRSARCRRMWAIRPAKTPAPFCLTWWR